MRFWLFAIPIAAFLQPQAKPRYTSTDTCLRMAPMPMAPIDTSEVRQRYRMPVARPDTAKLERLPVALLRPCYWNDSTPTRLIP